LDVCPHLTRLVAPEDIITRIGLLAYSLHDLQMKAKRLGATFS